MKKVGLIGIGFMGRGHLDNYLRLESEGFPVKLTAICDIDENKFQNIFVPGNLNMGNKEYDFSKYNLYTDIDEMLEREELDYVDIVLPTYLHSEVAIKAFNKGLDVLCEKPMALNVEECQAMIDAAEKNNKKLMIAQCLRFWSVHETVKDYIDTKKFGEALGAYFFRGGATPKWSYENWQLTKEKSGGVLLDQHIHDVDAINWLFGVPKTVSTLGKNAIKGSGYDIVSTQYAYEDGKVITAEDDWVLNGGPEFETYFRVNFEKGNITYKDDVFMINPNGADSFTPDLRDHSGYYWEIQYFVNALINDPPIETATPYSTKDIIRIAQAEMKSADLGGMSVEV